MDKLQQIERLIRDAEGRAAQELLKVVLSEKSHRQTWARIANLAWRSGVPNEGIRCLNPLVRPQLKDVSSVTDEEKAEYAICLIKIGAEEEALNLLREISKKETPQCYLYQAFAFFGRWDYESALPLIEKYLSTSDLDLYHKLVGRINLVACQVFLQRFPSVETELLKLKEETLRNSFRLLHGNVLEIIAQNFILGGALEKADPVLCEAEDFMREVLSADEFYIRKWRAISQLKKEPSSDKSVFELEKIKSEAERFGRWETVRQCDLFQALETRNETVAKKVLFGTPYPVIRKELYRVFPQLAALKEYQWEPPVLEGKSSCTSASLDLRTGAGGSLMEKLKLGFSKYRLLSALCSDFYKPFRIATLHSKIFPGEHYNPITSPLRVHQAIKLLRRWFEANNLPLRIEEKDRMYRLVATFRCTILLSLECDPQDRRHGYLRQLEELYREKNFSLAQACEMLEMSPRSVLRIFKDSLECGKIKRIGKRRSTRYRFGY